MRALLLPQVHCREAAKLLADLRLPMSELSQFVWLSFWGQIVADFGLRSACDLLLRFTPNMYHGDRRYWSFVEVSVFVNMSARFSLVSNRPNGMCVIFMQLKFTSVVFLRCPSFVLLPRSTASWMNDMIARRHMAAGAVTAGEVEGVAEV